MTSVLLRRYIADTTARQKNYIPVIAIFALEDGNRVDPFAMAVILVEAVVGHISRFSLRWLHTVR